MVNRISVCLVISLCLLASACSTSSPGTFVASSYISDDTPGKNTPLGPVQSDSCQNRFLYLFAYGEPPSIDEAIKAAKRQYPDTSYLVDISIQNRIRWGVGYSTECIRVNATAY